MSRCGICKYETCPKSEFPYFPCASGNCPMYDENLPDTICRCIANNYDAYEDCPYFKEETSEI